MTLDEKQGSGWQIFADRYIFLNCGVCIPNLHTILLSTAWEGKLVRLERINLYPLGWQ